MKLNSEVVLEALNSYLTEGTLESMQQEINYLKNAVAYLSNQLRTQNQEEIVEAILYKVGLV